MLGYLLTVCILVVGLQDSGDALSCIVDGNDVDWFIAMKVPTSASPYGGGLYLFITEGMSDWRTSKCSVIDECGPVYETIDPIYRGNDSNIRLLYNDAKPNGNRPPQYFGHMKGVVAFSVNQKGFWMIHSVPKFPGITRVDYPLSGLKYGQHFICVSFAYDQLSTIAHQLAMARPYVYSHTVPTWMSKTIPELYAVAKNKKQIFQESSSVAILKSVDGKSFTHLSKSVDFGEDLYSGLVAPVFHESLFVETWARGSSALDAYCDGPYKVFKVTYVQLEHMLWKTTTDHSKWAVSNVSSPLPAVCLGDINRQTTQFKRGGGTLCVADYQAWNLFRNMVMRSLNCNS